MGPNLLPEILAALLLFRLYPVDIIGDIEQAVLQVSLQKKIQGPDKVLLVSCHKG